MGDLSVTIVLPAGGARTAEMPDDVPIRELLPELVSVLELPTTGPDGRPMGYRLDSKALGRELREGETLAGAKVPQSDRLMVTADVTAGAEPKSMGGAPKRSLVNESPRFRRLQGDYEKLAALKAQSDLIDFQVVDVKPGFPPEKYIITFNCKSITGIDMLGRPQFGDRHQVAIYLHNEYPHRWPGLKWLTPIWHPNIKRANGSVCIDAAWWTAARSLDRLVVMLGEMAQYKNYHDDPTQPPFPWDIEAAKWSRNYRMSHPGCFPVDTRELLRPERVKLGARTTAKAARVTAKGSGKTTGKSRTKTGGTKTTAAKAAEAKTTVEKPAVAKRPKIKIK